MRPFIILLAALALAIPSAALTSAQNGQSLTIEVDAGYDGSFQSRAPMPVIVTLSNDGADIQGRLEVLFRRVPRSIVAQEVELPRGSRKRVVLWVQGVQTGDEDVEARLVVDGRHLAVARQNLTRFEPDVVFAAYVSDGPSIALPNLAAPLGRPATSVKLVPEELPDRDGLLTGLNMVILGPGELTPAQVAALRRWVVTGGTLLIDGGPGSQVGATLAELVPARLGNVIEGAAIGQRDIASARRLTPQPDARGIPDDGSPLWVERSLGAGVVRVSAVSLEQLPTRRAPLSFWAMPNPGEHMRAEWSIDLPSLRWLLPELALPSTLALGLFLLLYILLIGPLNYFVLRRLDRREWAWLTIPGGVILFTAIAYLVGFGLRGGTPILIDVTLVESAPGERTGQARANVGFAAVRRGSYDLHVEAPAIGLWPHREFFEHRNSREYILQQDQGFSAVSLQANVGEVRQVEAFGAVDVPFSLEANVHPGGAVTVVNTGANPIERVYLLRGQEFASLGSLLPGRDVEVAVDRMRCCFPQGVSADETSFAERIMFGTETRRFGFFHDIPQHDQRQWKLLVFSDTSSMPVSLDGEAKRLSATFYMVYLPNGERP